MPITSATTRATSNANAPASGSTARGATEPADALAPATTTGRLASTPLPPGRMGAPLLGETLAFLRDPFAFFARRGRDHGPVFRTRILGRPVAVLAGPEGVTSFLDADNITREGAHPAQVKALFGGINMNMLDGDAHRALKAMALDAFSPAALAAYVPELQRLVARTLAERADREMRGVEVFRRMAMEGIAENILGLAPGPETEALCADTITVVRGLLAIPIDLPWTRFGRALRARDRIFARYRSLMAAHREALAKDPSRRQDGLDRLLAARAANPSSGEARAFNDQELLLELHHVMLAGYIVFGLFVELVRRLDESPPLMNRAREEVTSVLGREPTAPLGAVHLRRLELLERMVREAKRTAPILPVVFGKARRDFVCQGYRIPRGWDVHLALSLCNAEPAVFTSPDAFDPDRYLPPRAEDQRHPHAYVPQGGGLPTGHRCLGVDYATVFGQVFLVELLRGYDLERKEPGASVDTALLPQEPRDGQRLLLTRRSASVSDAGPALDPALTGQH